MNSDRLHSLVLNVEDVYKLSIEDTVTYRGNIIIRAIPAARAENEFPHDPAPLLLRPVACGEARLLFAYDIQRHLHDNGFTDCELFIPYDGDEGEQTLILPDRDIDWVLCHSRKTRESDFDNMDELIDICKALAAMHLASRGLRPEEGNASRQVNNRLGKMPALFTKRLHELEKLKKKAARQRKEFDLEYMKNCNEFIEWGRQALEYITLPSYDAVVNEAVTQGGISHCDLTFQNIMVDTADRVYFTGFENSGFEVQVYDLANLIRRKMRKCNWDFDIAAKMIDAYHSVKPISSEEMEVMKGILLFPQKFWRIANSYYNMNKAWTQRNMNEKLLEATAEKEYFRGFAGHLMKYRK